MSVTRCAALAATLMTGPAASASRQQPATHWSASWTSAMQQPVASTPAMGENWSMEGFSDQTVRQEVRVSGGGNVVRIRLSNLYGTEPLRLAERHHRRVRWRRGNRARHDAFPDLPRPPLRHHPGRSGHRLRRHRPARRAAGITDRHALLRGPHRPVDLPRRRPDNHLPGHRRPCPRQRSWGLRRACQPLVLLPDRSGRGHPRRRHRRGVRGLHHQRPQLHRRRQCTGTPTPWPNGSSRITARCRSPTPGSPATCYCTSSPASARPGSPDSSAMPSTSPESAPSS